ncbi:hypothetical protein IQ268_11900 [Oculatella sp. LEGE 06141]|uniref:hypothetical protein n=1 Tax=Oculatella sp. LEGE 06141 TaxID=1828648 RepID=UPI0018825E1D|nr:hypothetical protein [Oculatella sp. LEGE 06141]MBE9179266.1 hypothetical protein [Oculatella sp. LEGE 06141]
MKKRLVLSMTGASALFFVSGFTGASCAVRELSPGGSQCFSFMNPTPIQLQYSGLAEQLFGLGLSAIDFGSGAVVQPTNTVTVAPVPASLEQGTTPYSWHDYGATFIEGSLDAPLPQQSEM